MRIQTYGDEHQPKQVGSLVGAFATAVASRSHGELQDILGQSVEWHMSRFLDRMSGYSCDFVESTVDYPSTYTGLRPIQEQIELVADTFNLARKPAQQLVAAGLPELPEWMEGWAAIPIEWLLVRPKSYGDKLESATLWMNEIVGNKGYVAGSWGHRGLHPFEHVDPEYNAHDYPTQDLSKRHLDFLGQFYKKYGSKIAILPVQMGRKRSGQSDRMARAHCRRSKREFPATSLEVACLLAMHPSRIGGSNTLGANCPGDVFAPAASQKIYGHEVDTLQMIEFRGDLTPGLISLVFSFDSIRRATNAPITFSIWDLP
ncbi:MAG: hypothetical protein ABIT47_03085 [Candidatus Paceibacterota bacterium]